MEVLCAREALLSNYEVLAFLREERSQQVAQAKRRRTGNVATLMLETLTSLEQTPCKELDPDCIARFMDEAAPFGLTKEETLMILNHCPTSPVEIHLLVEASDDRLSAEQVEDIIELVSRILLNEPAAAAAGVAEGQEQDQEAPPE